MSKIVLISFADSIYAPTGIRFVKEAENFGIFDIVQVYSEKDFDPNYKRANWFKLLQKGMGFWMWKSYFVKKTYNGLKDGDILIYIDAGCELNKDGISRFKDYLEIVKCSESGILIFQQHENEFMYTKADVFYYFGVQDNEGLINTGQIYAGAFFLRKCMAVDGFVNKLYNTIHSHFGLLSDNISRHRNFPGFITHKFDQSIFSVLVKTQTPDIISIDETYSKDWSTMNNYPILAKRKKMRTKRGLFMYRIKFPLCRFLDYLVTHNFIRF